MATAKEDIRSGYSKHTSPPPPHTLSLTPPSLPASPTIPATPATSNLAKPKRTASSETLATTFSELSTPSVAYPNPPLNTPASPSIAGDDLALTTRLSQDDLEGLTSRLRFTATTPPTSAPSSSAHQPGSSKQGAPSPPPNTTHSPKTDPSPHQTATSPTSIHSHSRTSSTTPTPTATPHLESTEPQVFEYSAWAVVAEEDTMRALARVAMLARDEHAKDPRRSVEEYYSARLAGLIARAEVGFDGGFLVK